MAMPYATKGKTVINSVFVNYDMRACMGDNN